LTVNRDQKITNQLQKQFVEVTSKNEQEVDTLRKQFEELKSNQESMLREIQNMAKTEEWFMDDPMLTFENALQRTLGERDEKGNYKRNLPQIEAAIKRIKEGDGHIEEIMYDDDDVEKRAKTIEKKKNKTKKVKDPCSI
jgi:nitrogen fixation-related uncharacterized protein